MAFGFRAAHIGLGSAIEQNLYLILTCILSKGYTYYHSIHASQSQFLMMKNGALDDTFIQRRVSRVPDQNWSGIFLMTK
jgi:hypothetical protein